MTTITIPNGWRPRHYQLPLWGALESGIKRAIAIWHRRAGKDDVCLHWTARSAMTRVGGYWHMLPQASQARKAIWDAVNPHTGKRRIDEAFPKEIRETTKDHEMFIRFRNGSTWQVVGSDNYNSLVGSPPVGVVYSEYALADPGAWAFLRPILAENGGWALFITTPRGENHAASLYRAARNWPNWFAELLTVEDTGAIPLSLIEQERRELAAERGDKEADAIIRQEYYCDFDAALPGAYYAEFVAEAVRAGRITRFPWEPSLPVETAWDLGIGDSTAIWFEQYAGNEPRVIDFYEASGVGLEHYAKVLRERPYVYAQTPLILPHDAGVSELGTGQRRVDTLKTLGLRGRILPRTSVDDRISAGRLFMRKAWINTHPLPLPAIDSRPAEDAEAAFLRMDRGLSALRQYRREWDEKLKAFKDRPLHDWTSHAADAWGYLAQGAKPQYDRSARPSVAVGTGEVNL